MLKYKLIGTEGNNLIYSYMPEGESSVGLVSVNQESGETEIIKMSDEDIGSRYAYKLINKLESFFENQKFDEEGMIAWY